jgi:hypothetical protein
MLEILRIPSKLDHGWEYSQALGRSELRFRKDQTKHSG